MNVELIEQLYRIKEDLLFMNSELIFGLSSEVFNVGKLELKNISPEIEEKIKSLEPDLALCDTYEKFLNCVNVKFNKIINDTCNK